MRKYYYIAAAEECGNFLNKQNERIEYNRTVCIFNEINIEDDGKITSAALRLFKTSRNFDARILKPGTRYSTVYFDQYGRMCGANE